MGTEKWKWINGYKGKYKISNFGNVKSYLFKVPKCLKPDTSRVYLSVSLRNNNFTDRMYIHIIVAKHFIKNHKDLPNINHKDEVKTNNHYSNLEYISHRDNVSYSKTKNSISGANCVHWIERMKTYQCSVYFEGKKHYLGSNKDIEVVKKRVLDFKVKNNLI